ncbi:MAG: hypothetical protein J0M29_20810 [Chitinophagales bacterium]|nr:hypothetical protein [Chitinophagales bacterium]
MNWINFLAFFAPLHVFAQSAILENPDIVWAAYITQDWEMDMPLSKEWDSGVITVKHVPVHHSGLSYSSPLLADLVYDAFMSGKLPVYKDPECTIPEDKYLDGRIDTIIHYDPVTFEEKIAFAYQEPDPERQFNYWRVRQLVYYNKKKAKWGTEVLSIAPVFHNKRYDDNDYPEFIPFFWFKPSNQPRNLQSENIPLAKKTFSGATEETTIFLEPDSLVKVTPGFEHPYQHYVEVFANKRHAVFYDSRMEHKLSMADRKNMLVNRDSILEFDPETYETSIEVRPAKVKSDHVTQLRLVQIWAWDEEKSKLYIWLDSVAPIYLRDPSAISGSLGFPLFYQKVRR